MIENQILDLKYKHNFTDVQVVYTPNNVIMILLYEVYVFVNT